MAKVVCGPAPARYTSKVTLCSPSMVHPCCPLQWHADEQCSPIPRRYTSKVTLHCPSMVQSQVDDSTLFSYL